MEIFKAADGLFIFYDADKKETRIIDKVKIVEEKNRLQDLIAGIPDINNDFLLNWAKGNFNLIPEWNLKQQYKDRLAEVNQIIQDIKDR